MVNVLDKPPDIDDIFVNAPGIGAIAPSCMSEFVDSGKKLRAVRGIDAILNHRENRPSVVLDLLRDRGNAPMGRWGEIDSDASLKFPAPGERNSENQARRRDEIGNWQPLHRGELAPENRCKHLRRQQPLSASRRVGGPSGLREGLFD